MKKIILTVCVALMLFASFLPHCSAEEDWQVGYISHGRVREDINGITIELLIITADAVPEMCETANKITINGEFFVLQSEDDAQEILNLFTDKYVEYRVNSAGRINMIRFDENPTRIVGATYNATTGQFSGVGKVLPVIYEENPELQFVPDENHIYDIRVYSYAVVVETFKEKNMSESIYYVGVWSSIASDFTLSIYADAQIEGTAEIGKCKGQLLNSNGQILQESEELYDGFSLMVFFEEGLPNQEIQYIVKLWLEDESGNRISPVVTCLHRTTQYDIVYGYVEDISYELDIDRSVEMIFRGVDAKKESYDISDSTWINNKSYQVETGKEEITSLLWKKLVKAAVLDGHIRRIYFEDEPLAALAKETYNPVTGQFSGVGKALPIFYENGQHVPYPDENHLYDITVYSYVVNITGVHSKDSLEVIAPIDFSCAMRANFKFEISATFETTVSEATYKAQLYDESGRKRGEVMQAVSENSGDIQFGTLPNETEKYTIVLWLENMDGEEISPEYRYSYTTEKKTIYAGYVFDATMVTLDFNHVIEIGIRDASGEETGYICADPINLNGKSVRTSTDVETALEQLKRLNYVEYTFDEAGNISVIRSATMEKTGETYSVTDAIVYKDAVEAKVQFSDTYEKKTALILVALYDETGTLTGWELKTVDVPADGKAVDVNIPMDAQASFAESKVFLWENLLVPGA